MSRRAASSVAVEFKPSEVLTASSPGEDRGQRTRPFDFALARRILALMLRYKARFWLTLALAALLAGVGATAPIVIGQTIGGIIDTGPGTLRAWMNVSTPAWLGIGSATLILLGFLWFGLMRWRRMVVQEHCEAVAADVRMQLMVHLQALDIGFFDRTKVGRILARGTSDIDALRRALRDVAPRLTMAIIQMIYAFIVMLTYDARLTLLVVVSAPVIYLVNRNLRERLASSYRRVQESYSLITANLAESISGIRVTQAFARQGRNARMFERVCREHERRHLVVARAQGLYRPLMDVATQIFIAVTLFVGGLFVVDGSMSVAALLSFMLLAGVFFGPVLVIGDMYSIMLQALAGAERIFGLLDRRPAALDPAPGNALTLPRTQKGMGVEFENVTFGYHADTPVLHDISFTARPNETIALVGHTGAGKSSIVNLLAKFYANQHGRILLDGIDVASIEQQNLHEQTGIVQQQNFLFTGTVADNIRFTRPDAGDDEVVEVCRRLDCLDILEALPDAFNTQVGERGSTLSMGQRQLVCFARALMADPRLLLLDEATSSIDTVSEARLQNALERLTAGRTCIVVAHRLSTIRRADSILVMEHGRIVERGTHAHLLEHGRLYPKLHAQFIRITMGLEREPADK